MRQYKFKVVKSRTNKSCVVNGNSRFSLTYEKNTNVYAPEETLGIMVFNKEIDAKRWINSWHEDGVRWKIKRVIPIGRGKYPIEISEFATTYDLENFYAKRPGYLGDCRQEPIPRTMCYRQVFVVD